MMGTEITPLTMALHTSALMGSSSMRLMTVPIPVAATMIK